MVVETRQRIRLCLVLEPSADLGVVERKRSGVAEPLRKLELVVVERGLFSEAVDVERALDRIAGDQRDRDHRLRLVLRSAGDGRGARIEMSLVDADGLPMRDAPPGEPDAERHLVGEDLVRPLVARPHGLQGPPRLIRLVDGQRVVRDELRERIGDPVEQGVEALLAQHVVEDVRQAAVRLDERRPVDDRRGERLLVDEAQRKSVVAHVSICGCSRSGTPISEPKQSKASTGSRGIPRSRGSCGLGTAIQTS